MLESCQKTIEKFATNVEDDSNNKFSVQKNILEEYRKMRLIQEEYIVQLKRANDLKRRKESIAERNLFRFCKIKTNNLLKIQIKY